MQRYKVTSKVATPDIGLIASCGAVTHTVVYGYHQIMISIYQRTRPSDSDHHYESKYLNALVKIRYPNHPTRSTRACFELEMIRATYDSDNLDDNKRNFNIDAALAAPEDKLVPGASIIYQNSCQEKRTAKSTRFNVDAVIVIVENRGIVGSRTRNHFLIN